MRIPMSHIRARGARAAYRLLRPWTGTQPKRIIRGGIVYEVDISEGLDLSLYVFGTFQSHVAKPRFFQMKEDSVIIDVGANAGIMSLSYSKTCPFGRVYSFEPTDYAFAKLMRNLELNPDLAKRITPIRSFVSEKGEVASSLTAYASWKVDKPHDQAHPVHSGLLQAATGAGITTLDDFTEQESLKRCDLIKIDTDGHELQVLRGAQQTLRLLQPVVVFEIGLYVLQEQDITFKDYSEFFEALGYRLLNAKNGLPVDERNYLRQIPTLATTDLIALPKTV